ncbi:tetratricopeptide repeat protein (plasmid) [Mesorhizobium sp. AaZ16]
MEQQVKDHPDNAGAWAFGSNVLAMLGEAERGEEWAERAVIIVPDDHLVHYMSAARTPFSAVTTERSNGWSVRSRPCRRSGSGCWHGLKPIQASIRCVEMRDFAT